MCSVNSESGVSIRLATKDDLPALTKLLCERDRKKYEIKSVSSILFNCNPDHILVWVALSNGEPAGMTALYLRNIKLENKDNDSLRVGYWGNLFVRERFRKSMLYLQLVFAMHKSMSEWGIDFIFTATRRTQVADGHKDLGYSLIGKIPLLFRPLRPLRLVTRYKSLGFTLENSSKIPDILWNYWKSCVDVAIESPKDIKVIEVQIDDSKIDNFVELLNISSRGKIKQKWTPDLFYKRFNTSIDKEKYLIFLAMDGDAVIGGSVCCSTYRKKVRVGVLLDIVIAEELDYVSYLLLDFIHKRLHSDGCDIVLSLGKSDFQTQSIMKKMGYYNSSEEYNLIFFPSKSLTKKSLIPSLKNWSFSLLNHDAF